MKNDSSVPPNDAQRQAHPSFAEALRFWLKLGFISFGGPTGQIAIMHTELVEKKRWISEERFLHALNYCMLLPGPEAQQLATYAGWLLHRTWGGIVAGALFVLPSAFILWLLSFVYMAYGNLEWVSAVFDGLKPAVLAIVLAAGIRIGKRALKNEIMWALASLAFVAIFFFGLPFPLIIVFAALLGLAGDHLAPGKFRVLKEHNGNTSKGRSVSEETLSQGTVSLKGSLQVCAVWISLWWAPILLVGALLGWSHVLFQQGVFFSKAAMVTFGGAYAVLPYVSQQAVENFQWMEAGQMLDGLALAETTPGPLIIVLQFVGFVGAWKLSVPFTPLLGATLGAAITTWATFLPCFLWIFLGAPFIERLRGNTRLTAALSAITAAVVGVVLNLAVWFGLHVLVPSGGPVYWVGIAIVGIAFVGMYRWNWDIIPVVAGAAVFGLLRWAVFL
ncbi:MAG: chromate efflux transporter [Verrucomicrobia bacterium]|nr:chromate efflux transporter [Verrucomicrobiota bacterium]MDA1066173.1 chromate efflux transporter [Verrucomicrobiota bacterium]